MKQLILVLIGIVFGSGLLTTIGCYFYWYKEDQKLDREMIYGLKHLKNLRAEKWCLDSIDRALDDALFWNNLATFYLENDLLYEGRECYSRAYDILEGITGRSYKPINYIPRGSKPN